MSRTVHEQTVHGIVDETGWVVFNAITTAKAYDAWSQFFRAKAHQYPLAEAVEAYKAIGYKCVRFKLVEVE